MRAGSSRISVPMTSVGDEGVVVPVQDKGGGGGFLVGDAE